jgi:hypothetical protein
MATALRLAVVVVLIAVPGVQSLDVTGPARGVRRRRPAAGRARGLPAGSWRARAAARSPSSSGVVAFDPGSLAWRAGRPRATPCWSPAATRRGVRGGDRRSPADRRGSRGRRRWSSASARCARARSCWRPPGCCDGQPRRDPLVGVRSAGGVPARRLTVDRDAIFVRDRAAVDLGRGDHRHRHGAGDDRGRPRPRGRRRRGGAAGPLRPPPGLPVAVERRAPGPGPVRRPAGAGDRVGSRAPARPRRAAPGPPGSVGRCGRCTVGVRPRSGPPRPS